MEQEIRLYTQPLCGYCDIIKEMYENGELEKKLSDLRLKA